MPQPDTTFSHANLSWGTKGYLSTSELVTDQPFQFRAERKQGGSTQSCEVYCRRNRNYTDLAQKAPVSFLLETTSANTLLKLHNRITWVDRFDICSTDGIFIGHGPQLGSISLENYCIFLVGMQEDFSACDHNNSFGQLEWRCVYLQVLRVQTTGEEDTFTQCIHYDASFSPLPSCRLFRETRQSMRRSLEVKETQWLGPRQLLTC